MGDLLPHLRTMRDLLFWLGGVHFYTVSWEMVYCGKLPEFSCLNTSFIFSSSTYWEASFKVPLSFPCDVKKAESLKPLQLGFLCDSVGITLLLLEKSPAVSNSPPFSARLFIFKVIIFISLRNLPGITLVIVFFPIPPPSRTSNRKMVWTTDVSCIWNFNSSPGKISSSPKRDTPCPCLQGV